MSLAADKSIIKTCVFNVNSFVAEGCKGNPAGVCLLLEPREDDFYKKVAIKIAASETAFVYLVDDVFHLRWFTLAGGEVELCGHATLAAASILWEKGFVNPDKSIRFSTASGILTATRDGADVTLDFTRPKIMEVKNKKRDVKNALGLDSLYIGKTEFDYLVEVASEEAVKKLAPDFEKLKKLEGRGICITAGTSSKDYDFVSRFFAPAIGINEDPVTGSVHCALAVYWGGVLNKQSMVGYQVSREGGMVKVRLLKDRVLLGGRARETSIPAQAKKLILSW
jgi:PhzF family phenazine biosynthesis protein